jgi:hypothetical protein
MLCGCLEEDKKATPPPEANEHVQKLNTWKLGDWLHDIDSAKTVASVASRGGLGTLTPVLIAKLDLVERANNMAAGGTVKNCWPRWKQGDPSTKTIIDTANTNHACLDAAGFKRGE